MRSLSSGDDPGDHHAVAVDQRAELGVVGGEVVAQRRPSSSPVEQPDLAGDGQGRRRVVAGDHRRPGCRPGGRRRWRRPPPAAADPRGRRRPEQRRGRTRPRRRCGGSRVGLDRPAATASTRRPRLASSCSASSAPSATRAQREAPHRARPSPAPRPPTTTDMRRRRASNGNRARSGRRCRDRRRGRRPTRRARTSRAASIGSPWATQRAVRLDHPARSSTARATRATSPQRRDRLRRVAARPRPSGS